MLIGDGNRHLRFDLQKLVLHVEDHLLDHLLRIFGLVDQVIQIGADKVETRSSSAMMNSFITSALSFQLLWMVQASGRIRLGNE